MTTLPQQKAVSLAIMLELDRLGYLEEISDLNLGEFLGVDRTIAWRYRRDLPQVKAAVAAIRAELDRKAEKDITQELDRLRAELATAENRLELITRRKTSQ